MFQLLRCPKPPLPPKNKPGLPYIVVLTGTGLYEDEFCKAARKCGFNVLCFIHQKKPEALANYTVNTKNNDTIVIDYDNLVHFLTPKNLTNCIAAVSFLGTTKEDQEALKMTSNQINDYNAMFSQMCRFSYINSFIICSKLSPDDDADNALSSTIESRINELFFDKLLILRYKNDVPKVETKPKSSIWQMLRSTPAAEKQNEPSTKPIEVAVAILDFLRQNDVTTTTLYNPPDIGFVNNLFKKNPFF